MGYEKVKADLRAAYDADADAREAMEDAVWKQDERTRFHAHLREAGARTLLEIGAGHGVSGRFFADRGLAVTCTDLSPELVERCRAKGLDARVMDFSRLDFPDGAFDAVFGMNCLLHVPKAELPGVLAGIDRVLAPGGLFYWGQYGGRDSEGVWDTDRYEPKRYFSFFTSARIEAAAEEYFRLGETAHVPIDGGIDQYQGLVLHKR
ncbi:class I SAM-dependent methyltransferase [Glycomyces albidus]|uniref:Methyltransferase domain-containing protein n=1 Tax=Glycomyces albidus TaxID=2656774 RepID=A0A6L5GEA0_9ACTN|nr:class I SAM-dependent methyltransferase [Glycomyces albidus]MQM28032.1 methyltransferase domain-containing protein [Glycomyces albidus]